MAASTSSPVNVSLDEVLYRGDDPHRPSLENRVAYQWETGLDTLGTRNATIRDQVTLGWAAEVLRRVPRPTSVVDVGCSRGNYLLMLNAMLGLDQEITYRGFDIDGRAIEFGRAYAETLAGYANCRFDLVSIESGLPLDDGSQSVVVCNDVIEHLPDVVGTLREFARVLAPGGEVIISTPLEDSIFKRAAVAVNKISGGTLYGRYYAGKDSELDADGQPIMEVDAGHDHISEMGYRELHEVVERAGLRITGQRLMPIMSGSRWFDRHPFLLSGLLFAEAVHEAVQRPSWAHGICLRLARA